ncbi:MAG: hypothetical protein Q8O56_07460 [Solirubrobacteraceae bacterium]|nr:hypothetical protein [Solirubrobacteraceae bacterium]
MSHHEVTPPVSMGEPATLSARVYPTTEDAAACVQLWIKSGATSTTIYPTADGLDELAVMLRDVAAARRALDNTEASS